MDNETQMEASVPPVTPSQVPQKKSISLFKKILIIVFCIVSAFGLYDTFFPSKEPVEYNQARISIKPSPIISQATASKTPLVTAPLNTESPVITSNGTCNKNECLFVNESSDLVHGYATLSGYFKQYLSEDLGKQVKCDALVITGGSENLIQSFRDAINSGNTINKYDEEKNLLVNLDMSTLDPVYKQKLLLSNKNKNVQLGVIRILESGRAASTCHSFVDILFVK